jgi:hypothetical protein
MQAKDVDSIVAPVGRSGESRCTNGVSENFDVVKLQCRNDGRNDVRR